MMPLSMVRAGEVVRIEDVRATEDMSKKLMEMGFNKDEFIKVIRNDMGPLMVRIKDSTLVLPKGMSQKIYVKYDEVG